MAASLAVETDARTVESSGAMRVDEMVVWKAEPTDELLVDARADLRADGMAA